MDDYFYKMNNWQFGYCVDSSNGSQNDVLCNIKTTNNIKFTA